MSKFERERDPDIPNESQILGALYGLQVCEYPGHLYMPHVNKMFGAGLNGRYGGASSIDVDREWYGGMPLPPRKERDLESRNLKLHGGKKPAGAVDKYSMSYLL